MSAERTVPPLVSFVVPTIGRESLGRAVRSIRQQTLGTWEAIVVGDGVFVPATFDGEVDDRVKTYSLHQGESVEHMGGGATRNYGMRLAHGDWLAFLDDDDTLDPDYVQELNDVAAFAPEIDAVVFRMDHPELGVLPDLKRPKLIHGHVGISFAVKTWIVRKHQLEFIPTKRNLDVGGVGNNEDITFLTALMNVLPQHEIDKPVLPPVPGALSGNIIVHDRVLYNVRPNT